MSNKTYNLVKELKSQKEIYESYISGEFSLADIGKRFDVSPQHVSNIIKKNNIGNPSEDRKSYKESEQQSIIKDVNNALPIEYIQPFYKTLKGITGSMNLFNSLTQKVRRNEMSFEIPFITLKRLNVLILELNIRKYIQWNNGLPEDSKKRVSDIAEIFCVAYSKVGKINSHFNKNQDTLLPNKDNDLIKVVMRNLELVDDVINNSNDYEMAIKQAKVKYKLDIDTIEKVLACEPYVKGANLEEFIKITQQERNE